MDSVLEGDSGMDARYSKWGGGEGQNCTRMFNHGIHRIHGTNPGLLIVVCSDGSVVL